MISVIMSIYNEKLIWIQQAIESILNQTYTDFEFIIIVDNPKIDDIIKEYLYKISNDSRIKIIYNESNIGLAQSLNKAIKHSKKKYIARMDADDISYPNRFEKELNFIEKSDFDMVFTNKININEDGKVISKDKKINIEINKKLKYANVVIHPSVLMKRNVVESLGGYRNLTNSEDYDLWLRMIEQGYKIAALDEYLLKYRIRMNSASVERQLEQYYIFIYIKKLSKERIKNNGKDSFSIEKEKEFLKRCHITTNKKKRFRISNELLKKSLDNLDGKDYFYFFLNVVRSLFICPSFTLERIINKLSEKI